MNISKSSFLKGTQCLKALYLAKHFPELQGDISESQQAIFDQGTKVGILAQGLFPGGTMAAGKLPEEFTESMERTWELVEQGCDVIYEAGFVFGNTQCFVDILVRDGERWKIFEVKSSTRVVDINRFDGAFQYHVLTGCGLEISDVSIVYINNKCVREGEIDVHELFTIESIMESVVELQPAVRNWISKQIISLQDKETLEISIGTHCFKPYDCPFMDTCWFDVPEYSVINIKGMRLKKIFELYDAGIMTTRDIPDDYPLSDNERIQVEADKTGEGIIEKDEIRAFLEELEYPLYFLDFESINPAIPLYDHSRPYQQIVFQYSLHILERPGGELQHREFLAQPPDDPRIPMIEQLIREIGKSGSILVYNQTFEMTCLKKIAGDFPIYEDDITAISSRIVDLMPLFRRKHYYTPGMRGSYSIKDVLPELVPSMNYQYLDINDGGDASRAYAALFDEKDPEIIAETRKNLLTYCGMDTLAMVEILRILYQVAEN